ncbi:MAG: 2-phosphosulfolactate phosphatase [Candidatus Kariarchaeaceae archaeon]|jgi:2-phosphosulfolactate phosphatase
MELLAYPELGLYARQFEQGARAAADQGGITVVIDVFRASNTLLELAEGGAQITPVMTVEEARGPAYADHVRVGEQSGVQLDDFDFDNSPVTIYANRASFAGKKVVVRTTNGTRGILAAVGSSQIIVGSFRNFSAVVDHVLEAERPVSFIGMGTLEMSRIEDAYCAQMFVISLLEKMQQTEEVEQLTTQGRNPFARDWRQEIMDERSDNPYVLEDYRFSLQLDESRIVPVYNQNTGILEY